MKGGEDRISVPTSPVSYRDSPAPPRRTRNKLYDFQPVLGFGTLSLPSRSRFSSQQALSFQVSSSTPTFHIKRLRQEGSNKFQKPIGYFVCKDSIRTYFEFYIYYCYSAISNRRTSSLRCIANAMLGVLRSRGLPALFPRLHFLQQVQQQSWRESCPIRTVSSTMAPDKPYLLALEEVEKVLTDVKANDVKVIPVRGLCGWTDHMVVATGRSAWHVRNIAQALVYKVKQKQKGAKRMLLPSMEGHEGGNWIVIDAGAVVVHALDEKARSYYNLENLWTEEKPPEGSSQDLKKAFVKIRPKNNSKKHIEERP